jgi:hypothetical protein
VSEGVDVEGVEGGWVLKGCSYGGGLRQCIAKNEVAVNGSWKWGCVWNLSRGWCLSWINLILYQGVEGCQFSGTSLSLVENEGVWGFVGSKDSLCCGVVVDPVMAMVTCTEEENRESAMLDIHPLVVLGEKRRFLFGVSRLGSGEGKFFFN